MDITLTMLLDLALPDYTLKDGALCVRKGAAFELDDSGRIPEPEMCLPVRGVRIWNGSPGSEESSALLYMKKQKSGVLFLCGGHRIPLETSKPFAEIFNKFEEAFITLRDWDMRLHQGIIEDKGLQYMLDVSEDILRHPMTVTDSGYKIVAFTKRLQSGDTIFRNAIEKGYLSADAIASLDRAGFIFERKAIIYRKGIEGLSYPMLNGTVFVEHHYQYMLVALFRDNDLTEGLYELFVFLLGQITLYVETNRDASRIRHFAGVSLLADLAEGKCAPSEFAERNRYTGLPEGVPYRLVSVRRQDGTMREFVREQLELALPGGIVFIYGDSVFVLWTSRNGPPSDETRERVSSLVTQNQLYIGVSEEHHTLCDLHRARLEATAACDLGLRVSGYRTLEKFGIAAKQYDERVFRYPDYYAYDRVAGSPALCADFAALLAEDNKFSAGNLRLLYAYLRNDCSKTRTASELFMHRNNVIYRIDKLEERLGLSLADEPVKMAFRLSFLALELMDPDSILSAIEAHLK